jgi:hypothetical protein
MFDSPTFPDELDAFLDGLLHDDDEPLTIDALAERCSRLRAFFDEQGVPIDAQAECAERFIRPMLAAKGPTGAERVEMARKFSAALGFDVTLPN